MEELVPRTEALRLVLESARPLSTEEVPAASAAGRVLAAPALAAIDLPPFASSAMDGFAVRPVDTPGSLRIVGESGAGKPWTGDIGQGEAVAISTGAVVPEGLAVVPVELVARSADHVEVPETTAEAHVRPAGGDISAGAEVLPAGMRLGAPQLAALAAAGITRIVCGRRPRVTVLATGTELRAPGEPLGPGQIYESNTTLLEAQVASAGGDLRRLPPVEDEPSATRSALAQGLEADVLITTGGVSMGEHDLVRPALADLGVREVFWRVAVRPGKPVSFGVRDDVLVFGLPGNPVSSLVGFELFVRPALLALQHATEPGPVFLAGRLAQARRRSSERDELARAKVRLDGDVVLLELLSGQESHMIGRSAQADALALIERGDGEAAAGDTVRYIQV
jgi:molybdopterin molybdotransferase